MLACKTIFSFIAVLKMEKPLKILTVYLSTDTPSGEFNLINTKNGYVKLLLQKLNVCIQLFEFFSDCSVVKQAELFFGI